MLGEDACALFLAYIVSRKGAGPGRSRSRHGGGISSSIPCKEGIATEKVSRRMSREPLPDAERQEHTGQGSFKPGSTGIEQHDYGSTEIRLIQIPLEFSPVSMFSNAPPLGVPTSPPIMDKVPMSWLCSARFAFQSGYPPVPLSDIPLFPALGESSETGHFGEAWMLPVRFDRLPHEAYFAWGFVDFPHAGTHMDKFANTIYVRTQTL